VLIHLDPGPQRVLQEVVRAARPLRVALVGGAVRDLLLHRVHKDPWRGLPDLDLVVEQGAGAQEAGIPPAAHRVALLLRKHLGGAMGFCQLHDAYGTAELEIDGVLLDLATARREWYPEPGANPRVSFGSLEDDLARRDLSINAMALVLGEELIERAGGDAEEPISLLDPHGGQRDLASRTLRFLHPGSLRDDPTRVVRAARYGARMGMELAPESLDQLHATLRSWPWRQDPSGDLPGLGTRLRMELEVLLGREPWAAGLALLQRWQALALIDPALQSDDRWPWRLRWAQRLLALADLPAWTQQDWLLTALMAELPDSQEVARRLQLPHRSQSVLRGMLRLRGWLDRSMQGAGASDRHAPASLCERLERHGLTPEAALLAIVATQDGGKAWRHLRRGLLRWLLRWRTLRTPLSAQELIREGMAPGPALGERLRELRREALAQERW
jgi:poly(A) polymerase